MEEVLVADRAALADASKSSMVKFVTETRAEGRASESRRRAHKIIAAICTLPIVLGAFSAEARNAGIDSTEMGVVIPNCNGPGACHFIPGAADPDLTVTITGPATLQTNESANYTIDINGAFGGGILGAGVFVAAYLDDVLTDETDAILGATSADAQITATPTFGAGGQLTHVDAQNQSVGTFSYTFSVLAPAAAGELRLEGAMQAFNGDNTSLGDEWQVSSKIITVPEPAAGLSSLFGALALTGLARRRAHSPSHAQAA